MYLLPILPDELRVPLVEGDQPVTAIVRPWDHAELAQVFDLFPLGADGQVPQSAIAYAVPRQLVRVEGLALRAADGGTVAFDPADKRHVAQLPFAWLVTRFRALNARVRLPESTAGNSVGPSASGDPSAGAA